LRKQTQAFALDRVRQNLCADECRKPFCFFLVDLALAQGPCQLFRGPDDPVVCGKQMLGVFLAKEVRYGRVEALLLKPEVRPGQLVQAKQDLERLFSVAMPKSSYEV